MTNDATRAKAEGLPEMNRRLFLRNTAVAGAVAATVAAPTVTVASLEPAPSELQMKIAAFLSAREIFLTAKEEDDAAAWEVYEATEHEVIVHPCATVEDVRLKARFFLNCEAAYDTIRNCFQGPFEESEETLRPFLRSLVGPEGGAA